MFGSHSFVIVRGVPFRPCGKKCCDVRVFVCVRVTTTVSKCL